jgi:hypothetical protein
MSVSTTDDVARVTTTADDIGWTLPAVQNAWYVDPKRERLQDLYQFVNTFGKNSSVDLKPVIREIVELLGLPKETVWGDKVQAEKI